MAELKLGPWRFWVSYKMSFPLGRMYLPGEGKQSPGACRAGPAAKAWALTWGEMLDLPCRQAGSLYCMEVEFTTTRWLGSEG